MEEFRTLLGMRKCRTKLGFIYLTLKIEIITSSKNRKKEPTMHKLFLSRAKFIKANNCTEVTTKHQTAVFLIFLFFIFLCRLGTMHPSQINELSQIDV